MLPIMPSILVYRYTYKSHTLHQLVQSATVKPENNVYDRLAIPSSVPQEFLGLIIHSHYNTSLITTAASVFLVLNNKHHLITSQCLLIILPAMPHVKISSILFLPNHCLLIFASDPFRTQCTSTWRTMTGAHGDQKLYITSLYHSSGENTKKHTLTYVLVTGMPQPVTA